MENPNLFNALSLIIAAVSLAALVLSFISFKDSSKTSKEINSKEHDLAENMKSIVLEIISNLRAIEAKTVCQQKSGVKIDYSNEIHSLEKIQSRPEFYLFLKSIENKGERLMMETRIRLLTSSDFLASELIWVIQILNAIKKETDLNQVIKQVAKDYKNNWNQLVKELCEMESILNDEAMGNVKRETEKRKEFDKAFFARLFQNEGKDDANVKLFYAVIEGDTTILEQAFNEGADIKTTEGEIIKKYQSVYDEFIKKYKPRE